MRQHTKVLTLVLALALVGAACTTRGPRTGGAVTAYLLEPTSLNPVVCGDTTCAEVVQRLFDSLTDYDPRTAALIPGAATTWDVNEDGTVFTFRLREGATFHDGSPVTAADFVRGLTTAALQETASPVAGQLDGIVGFGAAQSGDADVLAGVRQGADELELVIELDAPNADFLLRTGHPVFSPLPAAALEDPAAFREQPTGNGPYTMDGPWRRNERISVVQFEDYNGARAGFLEGITWRIFATVDSAYIEFQDGELDVTVVPPEQYRQAEADHGEAFIGQATAGNQFLAAFTSGSPTDDPNFRRAVSMAINREDIIRSVFDDQQIAATSIVPPATPGHRPNVCTYCTFDVAEAQRLLELAGGPPDDPIVFTWVDAGTHDRWIQAVREQLRENLGIRSRTEIHAGGREIVGFILGMDPVTREPVEPKLEAGFIVLGWAQDYPTPDNWLFTTLHSEQDGLFSGYSNPEFDRIITEAQGTVDATARLSLQQQAEDIALDEMPALPMWYDRTGLVYNSERIGTFVADVQQGYPAWEEIALA